MKLITLGLGGRAADLIRLGFESGEPTSLDPAVVWNYVLANGKTAAQTLIETNMLVLKLAKIHGLIDGVPLVNTATTRSAGDIVQDIEESGDAITVTVRS